jgi:hypothetical protein
LAHRVVSRRRSNSVAFGAKRTFSEPRLKNRIYEVRFKIAHHGTERTIIARPRPNALADVALGAKEANTLSTSLQLVAGDPVIAPPGQ